MKTENEMIIKQSQIIHMRFILFKYVFIIISYYLNEKIIYLSKY